MKSAGNEFGYGGHAFVQAFEGGVIPIEWTTKKVFRRDDTFEFWFSSSDDLTFNVGRADGALLFGRLARADRKRP